MRLKRLYQLKIISFIGFIIDPALRFWLNNVDHLSKDQLFYKTLRPIR